MTKHSKLLEKISTSPTPSDIRWNDLTKILNGCGYVLMNGSGSRRKFYNKEVDDLIICHEPHPRPEVDKGCIDDVVNHLRNKGYLK